MVSGQAMYPNLLVRALLSLVSVVQSPVAVGLRPVGSPPASPLPDSALAAPASAPSPAPASAAAPGVALSAPLADSELSAPSLLAAVTGHLASSWADSRLQSVKEEGGASTGLTAASSEQDFPEDGAVSKTFAEVVRESRGAMIFGTFIVLLGLLIHWFNERRSAKCYSLFSRGLEECISISDPDNLDSDTLGRLVHVQGQTRGVLPVVDPQFQGALVKNCLKLQSTVEVFEWVQTTAAGQLPRNQGNQGNQTPKDKKVQYNFVQEWSTVHHNSLHFQRTTGKPSPENPRPPGGLMLGTFTTVCPRVQLGGFTFTEAMVEQFRNFVPAMQFLPSTVSACGMTFFADNDGYFYARPGQRSASWSGRQGGIGGLPQIGDLRVRFLCVPEGEATVVAVHCEKDGQDTFVPYRSIPRCCSSDMQDRQRLIEEGERPLREVQNLDKDMMPCVTTNRLSASCFCCPCSTISCVCTNEVVTEEIFHVSATRDPIEKPFEWVVTRSVWRVTLFRLMGLLITFLGIWVVEKPLSANIDQMLASYHGWTRFVLAVMLTFAALAMVISMAHLSYQPTMTCKWLMITFLLIAAPLMLAR